MINDAAALSNQATQHFGSRLIVKELTKTGYYRLPWGGQVAAVTKEDVTTFGWLGATVSTRAKLNDVSAQTKQGQKVGEIKLGDAKSVVYLSDAMPKPDLLWRASRWLSFLR